jgi:hypothetical protein
MRWADWEKWYRCLTLGNAPARGPRHNFISTVLWQLSTIGIKHVEEPVDAFRANEPSKDDKAQETSVIV